MYLVQVPVLAQAQVPVPIPALVLVLVPALVLAVVQEVLGPSLVASEAERVAPRLAAQTLPSCCSQQN